MADNDVFDTRKAHRKSHSGRKAEKRKDAKKKHSDHPLMAKQRNPKAFAIQSVTKAERKFRRTMDIKGKGYHVPAVDRIPARPPPTIVGIVGPPKVGKTTLMKCLVRNFTRQKLTSINGPVTVISGKKKRITFIECSNDINQMIDIAKIADVVLLLIDAKSGFEMETFEFMNMCHVHGMPRLMGVLTHLDLFDSKKSMQKTKSFLKRRYQIEIPRGEKMFYLSGILHGEYLKNEIHNLGRFLSIMKFEPSKWKKSHPHVFVDRIEDVTDAERLAADENCNRTVCLYGYARGAALKKNCHFHIPGCGDYFIKNINFLPDPCPLPDKNKKRSLNEKERLIYAPMSGVGGIVYDKDAVYIEVKEDQGQADNEDKRPSDKLVGSITSMRHPMDQRMKSTSFQLFPGAKNSEDWEDSSSDEDEDNMNDDKNTENQNDTEKEDDSEYSDDSEAPSADDDDGKIDDDITDEEEETGDDSDNEMEDKGKKRKLKNSLNDDDDSYENESECSLKESSMPKKKKSKTFHQTEGSSDSEMGQAKWKENLMKRAADDFYQRQKETFSLQKLIYGQSREESKDVCESQDKIDGLLRVAKHEKDKKNVANENANDCSKFNTAVPRWWTDETELEKIKDCFVTGKWDRSEDAAQLLENDDDELYGDFEDFETGAVHKAKSEEMESSEDEDEDNDDDEKEKAETEQTKEWKEMTLQEKRMEKKKKLKEVFNKQFDDSEGRAFHDDLKLEADAQGELNKAEFENMDEESRVHYEGFRPGLYLRVEVEEVPCEFVNNFEPSHPVILGALLKGEDKMGFLQVRIKRHRWYPKILKSRDPLIVSLGWRRFQTVPLYYIVDHNMRQRHLKYTPKHMHCMAAFWGPITQQKSGILGVQTVNKITSKFRIAAVGNVTEVNKVTSIVKKLKLIGTPLEIFKKTAFIEGMFHSQLEGAKYEGAAIKTVSGLRGIVKKAIRTPPGVFRATFEDKILMSDIVFLRTWVSVTVPQFCIHVTSLLLPPGEKGNWEGARTVGKLRYDNNLHAPVKEDSKYTPIERKFRHFAPLVVPKTLQKALPFKDKIVHAAKKTTDPESERVAVIKERKEREISKVLGTLKSVYRGKVKKQKQEMWQRARQHRLEKRKEEQIHHKKVQAKKKRIMSRRPNKAPDA